MLLTFKHLVTPYCLVFLLLTHLIYTPVIAQNADNNPSKAFNPTFEGNLFGIFTTNTTPSLGDTVIIEITSGQISRDSISSARWFIDGELDESFNDFSEIEFKVFDLSKPITITCKISFYYTGIEQYLVQEVTLHPVQLDVIWEGEVVTPAHYLGYPRPTINAPIRVSADLLYQGENRVYTEEDFSFIWNIAGKKVQGVRGIGGSVITIPDESIYNLSKLNVEVIATKLDDQSFVVKREVVISRSSPRLLVYESQAIHGVLHNKVFDGNISSKKITLLVYPYFFPLKIFNDGSITYRWFLNDKEDPGQNSRKVDLSLDGGEGLFFFKIIAEWGEGEKLRQQSKYDFVIEL